VDPYPVDEAREPLIIPEGFEARIQVDENETRRTVLERLLEAIERLVIGK